MYPTRRLIASASRVTSMPATHAVPSLGRSRPQSIRMVVVLPAPLGPRNPKISPVRTPRLRLETAVTVPNRRVRFVVSMARVIPTFRFDQLNRVIPYDGHLYWTLSKGVNSLPFGTESD